MAGKNSFRKQKKAAYKVQDFLSGGRMYTGTGVRIPVRKEKTERKRRLTKAQKRVNASKRSTKRRVAKALQKFLKAQNPAAKFAGAKIRRNKGSITIIPIKLRRASR